MTAPIEGDVIASCWIEPGSWSAKFEQFHVPVCPWCSASHLHRGAGVKVIRGERWAACHNLHRDYKLLAQPRPDFSALGFGPVAA